jgi:DNA-directed RNA polymerase subunit omega
MARVTVEDCLENVDNRFALVHVAAQRTKQLYRGSQRLVECKNRNIVAALREIAESKVIPIANPGEEEEPKKAKKTA